MWAVFPTRILSTAVQQTLRWQLIVALYNLNMSVNCSKCATLPLGFLKQISKFLTYTLCFPAELNLTICSLCNDNAYRARRCSRDKDTEVLLSFKEQRRTVVAFHSMSLHHTIRSCQVVVYKKWSFPSLWRSKANCLMFSYGCSCTFHIEMQNVMLLLPQKVLWVILMASGGRGKYGFKASSASCFVTM